MSPEVTELYESTRALFNLYAREDGKGPRPLMWRIQEGLQAWGSERKGHWTRSRSATQGKKKPPNRGDEPHVRGSPRYQPTSRTVCRCLVGALGEGET